MKSKSLLLIPLLILITFPARADFTGPPMEAFVAAWIAGLVGGFFVCALMALITKRILEAFTQQKRKHIWLMALFMYLFLALFLYLDDAEHILSDFNDDGVRTNLYWTFLFLSLSLGFIIGYLITPKKTDKTKE